MTPACRQIVNRVVLTTLVGLIFNLTGMAQRLVFPHLVDGEGIRMEILFTNPGNQPEKGRLLFRGPDGSPETFWLGGSLRSSVDVVVPSGGVWSLRSDGRGDVKVGWAVYVPDRPDSQLNALLIFTINETSQLSVPASAGAKQGHFVVERNSKVRSGLAIANDSDAELSLRVSLLEEGGGMQAEKILTLGPFQKMSRFLSEEAFFEELANDDFRGSVHFKADRSFHLLGLRQSSNGSLTGLAGSDSAFPNAGSQLLFLVDSGINPRLVDGVTPQILKDSTVLQITQISAPPHSPRIRLKNTHPDDAVTVQVRLLNDRCEEVLRFLMVLACGEALSFEPLQTKIPGSDLTTSQLLFGDSDLLSAVPISAHDFGNGTFIVEVQAVGTSTSGGETADILFPNELAPIGGCNVTPLNTGSASGADDNLWICNALPMSFDYLVGTIASRDEESCRGRMILGNNQVERASSFLLELTEDAEGCLRTDVSSSCRLRRILEQLPTTDCTGSTPGVVVALRSSDPTYTLRR